MQRRPGNIGVKRKSVFGHVVIAEATKATGAVMAQQMQDIADASRDLERSKIEVQLKLFSEQMSYQWEKDRRLYENAAIANDNTRLSILKQREMVSCLSHLSTVLSNSLSMNKNFAYPNMPQTAPQEHNTVSHHAPAHTAGQVPPKGTVTANHSNLGGNEDRNLKNKYSGDDLPNNLDKETTSINATFPLMLLWTMEHRLTTRMPKLFDDNSIYSCPTQFYRKNSNSHEECYAHVHIHVHLF